MSRIEFANGQYKLPRARNAQGCPVSGSLVFKRMELEKGLPEAFSTRAMARHLNISQGTAQQWVKLAGLKFKKRRGKSSVIHVITRVGLLEWLEKTGRLEGEH